MTGGTCTTPTDPNSRNAGGAATSDCLSISPRTIEDVLNCLCGLGNNSPRVLGLFSNGTRNQALRDSLGCVN